MGSLWGVTQRLTCCVGGCFNSVDTLLGSRCGGSDGDGTCGV